MNESLIWRLGCQKNETLIRRLGCQKNKTLIWRLGCQKNETLIWRLGCQKNKTLIWRLGCQKNKQIRRRGWEVNDSLICRVRVWIVFHVTCMGSVLLARGNRNDLFILPRSSGTDLWTIFHVFLYRLRRGNRKDLFTSFTFAWLGLVRREWYSFTSNNYRFCYFDFFVLYLQLSAV